MSEINRTIAMLEEMEQALVQTTDSIEAADKNSVAFFKDAGGNESSGGCNETTTRDEQRTDRRTDLRVEDDERWRRDPGGERGGDHSDYDWAGGAILERYLTGGDDWYINNDPDWTKYMQSNSSITSQLRDQALKTAQDLLTSGANSVTIDESFPMEIENGEGVVGYQYLHGTNETAGGFQRQGNANIVPDGTGGYVVTMNMAYTWNDIIDPNPQYSTDVWKSTIAEIITLGQADPYEIHVSWTETTVIHLDSSGDPVSISNP